MAGGVPPDDRDKRVREAPEGPPTPPPSTPMMDHSFTLQAVLDLKESVGKLIEAVDTLKRTVERQGSRLDKIETKIAWFTGGAVVAVTLLTAVVGFAGWAIQGGLTNLAEALAKLSAP